MNAIKLWLLNKVKDYLLRNWKTSLAGILGVLAAQIPALAPFQEPILALAVALVALLAKDGDQTGTTALPRSATLELEPVNGGFAVPSLPDDQRPPG